MRRAALRCLGIFPRALRGEVILPFKRLVVRGLSEALDDPKRWVRKEAVDCRMRWGEVDEPAEE